MGAGGCGAELVLTSARTAGRRPAETELLFQVLTEREERSAIAIASNEPDGWTKTFTDPRLCAAIVDRLTFGGQIIATGTTSFPARAQPQTTIRGQLTPRARSSPGVEECLPAQ
jgi:hypothetical protein